MKTNPIYHPMFHPLYQGEPFKCQATGRTYAVTKAGNVVRMAPPKPWREGKSKRREVIKARRYAKEGLSLP